MPYHQGLARPQGDPGFFGSLGKFIGGVARAIPGPIGAIAGAITGGAAGRAAARRPTPTPVPRGAPLVRGTQACPPRKRRRIDPLNVKALRRANTRQRAFLRMVDSTLKTMPTKSSVQRRRAQIRGAK